jgi:hypothetical protein
LHTLLLLKGDDEGREGKGRTTAGVLSIEGFNIAHDEFRFHFMPRHVQSSIFWETNLAKSKHVSSKEEAFASFFPFAVNLKIKFKMFFF